jgi:hypothetical protein
LSVLLRNISCFAAQYGRPAGGFLHKDIRSKSTAFAQLGKWELLYNSHRLAAQKSTGFRPRLVVGLLERRPAGLAQARLLPPEAGGDGADVGDFAGTQTIDIRRAGPTLLGRAGRMRRIGYKQDKGKGKAKDKGEKGKDGGKIRSRRRLGSVARRGRSRKSRRHDGISPCF